MVFVDHIPDEALEQYAMGKLPESEVASLEEHLLICLDCQYRLDAMDEYVAAMRAAAVKLVDE
ncbi:MAG TPA: zf-HC2 domain-containing protein [Paludibaculum sp.]